MTHHALFVCGEAALSLLAAVLHMRPGASGAQPRGKDDDAVIIRDTPQPGRRRSGVFRPILGYVICDQELGYKFNPNVAGRKMTRKWWPSGEANGTRACDPRARNMSASASYIPFRYERTVQKSGRDGKTFHLPNKVGMLANHEGKCYDHVYNIFSLFWIGGGVHRA